MKYHSISRTLLRIRWGTVGAIVVLIGAAGLVAGSAWLSVQFIVDPRSVVWLNQYLPAGAKIPVGADEPRTLAEVQAALKKAGLTTGDPILLERSNTKATDLLLPVLKRKENCDLNCDRITELRVYRPVNNSRGRSRDTVQMISQMNVDELEESFVVAPIAKARPGYQSADRALPLGTLQRFEDKTTPWGTWLNLSGQMDAGDNAVTYGQVIHYNPDRIRLSVMLRWTSPPGEPPTWQKPAKGNPSELSVNQTVGLEPDFQVYQLRSRKGSDPVLQPIDLKKPALENGAYVDALYLAQNGLWSTALEILQSVKQRNPSEWTLAAQAQMTLVEKHAQVTRSQAEKPWVSAGQQALVNLTDGRWFRAQQLLQNPTDLNEVASLLKTDSGRLWKRVSAALRINPVRQDVQTWGALILAARQSRSSAIAWLKKQPQERPTSRAQIIKLLSQLDSSELEPDIELPPSPTPKKSPRPSNKPVKVLP
ncbi:hypothetical protein ACKFKG_05645 [Phormidesmis sp. 146-35]